MSHIIRNLEKLKNSFTYIENLVFFGGSSMETTGMNSSNLQLAESEQIYKSLFDYNPHGIYSLDLQGNFTSMNEAMKKTFGYTDDDLMKPITQYLPLEWIDHARSHFLKALKGEIQIFETESINKNGERIFVKIVHLPIIVNGEIVGVYGIARDITKQKEKERELQQTKELLESLFQHSADCIAIVSLDGIVINVNDAVYNIYGWKPEEIIGEVFKPVPDEALEEYFSIIEKVKQGEESVGVETVRKKKDGSIIDVSITFSALRDGAGNIIGMTFISRDISERKRTVELISRSEKLSAIGQLAASVAHEIRNPLTSIKGFVQLFRGNIHEQFVDLMLSELERIDLIVNEFLLLAKPQISHFDQKDVTNIIHHTLTIMESQALLNNVEIITLLEAHLPVIWCDENKIKQVLINVMQNAVEAMPDGGKLEIITELIEEEILIQIKDEGHGISEERIKKLGEPFYSNKEKGTGLGLMVCYKIMEEHQGRIEIESELGQGTTVKLYLPKEKNKS
jgi:PAS domain S-box-containing protein